MQAPWNRPLKADPRTDLVFHMLFGNPEHKGVCIGLLNDVLPLGPWMCFFNESSKWTEIPPEACIPAIQEATAMMYRFTEDERQRSLAEGRLRAERIEARAARTERAEERARELEEKLQLEAQARWEAEQARQEEAQARLLAEQVSQKEARARQELERQLQELKASIARGTN